MNFFNNIDLKNNSLLNARIQPTGEAPSGALSGQMYFNTKDKQLYYYNGTGWVALNKIDISGKLDKVTDATANNQAYIKKTDGTQSMQDISAAVSANTLALRDANGRLKVATGVANDDAVNFKQLNDAIEAGTDGLEHTDNKVTEITNSSDVQYPTTGAVIKYVKVKDVTLDGTSIVENGIVALESTYHFNYS